MPGHPLCFPPMISSMRKPWPMPWRKRKASRMLLFPLALAPTITVKGPIRRVSSAKFLKLTKRSDVIIRRYFLALSRLSKSVLRGSNRTVVSHGVVPVWTGCDVASFQLGSFPWLVASGSGSVGNLTSSPEVLRIASLQAAANSGSGLSTNAFATSNRSHVRTKAVFVLWAALIHLAVKCSGLSEGVVNRKRQALPKRTAFAGSDTSLRSRSS